MALDPRFIARKFSKAVLTNAAANAVANGFCLLDAPDGQTLALIPHGRRSAPNLAEELDVYGLLDSLGVVAVSGSMSGSAISLSGGSVSQCQLMMGSSPLRVNKRVESSALPAQDSIERHRLEAQWIEQLNRGVANRLFPRTAIVADSGVALTIESEFIGAYTLGEWILQREHAGVNDQMVQNVVTDVFRILKDQLYSQQPAKKYLESYVDKCVRRMRLIDSYLSQPSTIASLYREGGIVNGLDCRPLTTQIKQLFENREVLSLLTPRRDFLCHGDLIPEDILVSGTGEIVAFVDPNPQNADPLTDLGKFVMSCFTCYDLALRDWLNPEVTVSSHTRKCIVNCLWPKEWRQFAERQLALGAWLADQASSFLPKIATDGGRGCRDSVILLAGLQAVCIVPFHLIHHDRPIRATHFMAVGQSLLEQGLRAYGI